jgi:hypothetical protein
LKSAELLKVHGLSDHATPEDSPANGVGQDKTSRPAGQEAKRPASASLQVDNESRKSKKIKRSHVSKQVTATISPAFQRPIVPSPQPGPSTIVDSPIAVKVEEPSDDVDPNGSTTESEHLVIPSDPNSLSAGMRILKRRLFKTLEF